MAGFTIEFDKKIQDVVYWRYKSLVEACNRAKEEYNFGDQCRLEKTRLNLVRVMDRHLLVRELLEKYPHVIDPIIEDLLLIKDIDLKDHMETLPIKEKGQHGAER